MQAVYAISSRVNFMAQQRSENIIENYSNKYGIKFSILRYGSIYGTKTNRLNAIHGFIKQAIKKKIITRVGLGNEKKII